MRVPLDRSNRSEGRTSVSHFTRSHRVFSSSKRQHFACKSRTCGHHRNRIDPFGSAFGLVMAKSPRRALHTGRLKAETPETARSVRQVQHASRNIRSFHRAQCDCTGLGAIPPGSVRSPRFCWLGHQAHAPGVCSGQTSAYTAAGCTPVSPLVFGTAGARVRKTGVRCVS